MAAPHEKTIDRWRGLETEPAPKAGRRPAAPRPEGPAISELEFVGCAAVPMTWREFRRYEGRLEVWDAETETAWMVREPTSPTHESPSHGLTGLVERIGAVRGAPIKCFGAMDLLMRDERGVPRRIMQADQTVYLYPARAELVGSSAMVVGKHNYPDMVLEVDHTTDVRRGKLKLYEAWGFPEVWVEVPDQTAPSRPRGRRPGLTIHLLEGGAYRESPVSLVFPDWRATAIHEALGEIEPSEWTHATLKRLGRVLGARDGTGPDDDPLLRDLRGESRAEGHAAGREEGHAAGRQEGWEKGHAAGVVEGRAAGLTEGIEKGRLTGMAETVRQILASRGIEVSAGFPADAPGFAESPKDEAVSAAFACDSERDFLARLRKP